MPSKRNLGHKSFFSLDRYVNEFIQIISFFERSSLKLGGETVVVIVLCCCHQACCLLYYLGEINSGIHMYQFTFEPLHFWSFCFGMWLWFRIWTKILTDRRIWRKKGTDRRICISSIHPSQVETILGVVTRVEINPSGKRYWSSRPYSVICWTGSFSWYIPFSSFSFNKCWLNLEDK